MGENAKYNRDGARRLFIGSAVVFGLIATGSFVTAFHEGSSIRWFFAVITAAASATLGVIAIRLFRREVARSGTNDTAKPHTLPGVGSERDWLDRVAPIRNGAHRESGGGLILFGVIAIAGGTWMLIALPFWRQLRLMPAGLWESSASSQGSIFFSWPSMFSEGHPSDRQQGEEGALCHSPCRRASRFEPAASSS